VSAPLSAAIAPRVAAAEAASSGSRARASSALFATSGSLRPPRGPQRAALQTRMQPARQSHSASSRHAALPPLRRHIVAIASHSPLAPTSSNSSARMATATLPAAPDTNAAADATSVRGQRLGWECAICLGTGDGVADVQRLSCSHSFCRTCIGKYSEACAREGRMARCPECKREMQRSELPTQPLAGSGGGMLEMVGGPFDPSIDLSDLTVHQVLRAARQAHLKRCPACGTLIEKDGGCDHMRCRCGQMFRWSEVPSLAPCNQVHCHPEIPMWGSTCPNCTLLGELKLVCWRLGVIAAAAAALPTILGIGTAVLLICEGSRVFLIAYDGVAGFLSGAWRAQQRRLHRHRGWHLPSFI